MVRSVLSWLVAGAVLVVAPGCSSIGHMFSDDDEPAEEHVSQSHGHATTVHTQQVDEVAEAPAPRPANAGSQDAAALRAQIAQLQVEIAAVRAQQQMAPPPMDNAAAVASLSRINMQINDLQAQRTDLERKIGELENQRRMVAASVGHGYDTTPISAQCASQPSDAALQAEEARLRMQLQKYNQPGN